MTERQLLKEDILREQERDIKVGAMRVYAQTYAASKGRGNPDHEAKRHAETAVTYFVEYMRKWSVS